MKLSYYFDFNTVEQVRAIPIQQVYSRYAGGSLRRIGKRLEARCPIHGGGQEKHPSFNLYLDRKSWRCYGCGDTISLTMALLNCSFSDAIKTVGMDFGIPLENMTQEQSRLNAFRLKAERELEARGRKVENEARQIIASLFRAVNSALAGIRTTQDLEDLGSLYHISTVLENYLETLQSCIPEDRKSALADARRGGWC